MFLCLFGDKRNKKIRESHVHTSIDALSQKEQSPILQHIQIPQQPPYISSSNSDSSPSTYPLPSRTVSPTFSSHSSSSRKSSIRSYDIRADDHITMKNLNVTPKRKLKPPPNHRFNKVQPSLQLDVDDDTDDEEDSKVYINHGVSYNFHHYQHYQHNNVLMAISE